MKKNYLRTDSIFVKCLSILATILVSFSLISQEPYAKVYNLNIALKNKNDVNTKTSVYSFFHVIKK